MNEPGRDGNGDGRTYTITFVASDGTDSTEGSVQVTVPHDQGKGNGKGKKAGKTTAGMAVSSWGEIKDSMK
tara:strand:- start:356 stop:568 length:213 start_codon:yes stop_codon:yes gene_type:complete